MNCVRQIVDAMRSAFRKRIRSKRRRNRNNTNIGVATRTATTTTTATAMDSTPPPPTPPPSVANYIHRLENCWVKAQARKMGMLRDAIIISFSNHFRDLPAAHVFQWLGTCHAEPTPAPAYASARMQYEYGKVC